MKYILFLLINISILASNFDISLDFVLGTEGSKVVKNKTEHSKYGITIQILSEYNKQMNTNWIVDRLTVEQVKSVAYTMFWDKYYLKYVPSQRKATAVFDFLYHTNARNATKVIQNVLNDWIYKEGRRDYIKEDGLFGPRTLNLLLQMPEKEFISKFKVARIMYLKKLTGWSRYKNGWMKRINLL